MNTRPTRWRSTRRTGADPFANAVLLAVAAVGIVALTGAVRAADNVASGGTITYTDASGLNPRSSPPYAAATSCTPSPPASSTIFTIPTAAGWLDIEYLIVASGDRRQIPKRRRRGRGRGQHGLRRWCQHGHGSGFRRRWLGHRHRPLPLHRGRAVARVTTPANGKGFYLDTPVTAEAMAANGTEPYTVTFHVSYNGGAFAQAGSPDDSAPYTVDLALQPPARIRSMRWCGTVRWRRATEWGAVAAGLLTIPLTLGRDWLTGGLTGSPGAPHLPDTVIRYLSLFLNRTGVAFLDVHGGRRRGQPADPAAA